MRNMKDNDSRVLARIAKRHLEWNDKERDLRILPRTNSPCLPPIKPNRQKAFSEKQEEKILKNPSPDDETISILQKIKSLEDI